MLHRNVHMLDINVDQWRAAQRLVLRSGKRTPRIVIIHDHGRVQKARFWDGRPVTDAPHTVRDVGALARRLYENHRDEVDFVMVIDRDSMDEYFARMQNSWSVTTDLDEFVSHTYALLDEYPTGIAVWPGTARSQLGMQWRIGATREEVLTWVRQRVEPDSWIVLGAHGVDRLEASLMLHFDGELELDSMTTADPERVDLFGERAAVLGRMIDSLRDQGGRVCFALCAEMSVATQLLEAQDKRAVIAMHPSEVTVVLRP